MQKWKWAINLERMYNLICCSHYSHVLKYYKANLHGKLFNCIYRKLNSRKEPNFLNYSIVFLFKKYQIHNIISQAESGNLPRSLITPRNNSTVQAWTIPVEEKLGSISDFLFTDLVSKCWRKSGKLQSKHNVSCLSIYTIKRVLNISSSIQAI